MQTLLDGDLDQRCKPTNTDSGCKLADGRNYAAYVNAGVPENGIYHCLKSADAGFLSRESLITTIVHEVAHLADSNSTDHSYRHSAGRTTTYAAMTRQQAIRNGDSYSEFAREMFTGGGDCPMVFGLSAGVLLSSGRPQFALTASTDFRTRSGIEVFDLIGGVHYFIGLDPSPRESTLGVALDLGILTRSPQSHFFADTRLGVFATADADTSSRVPPRFGMSVDVMLGWANSGFRAGVNVRQLFDFLEGNHAVIIGGEFNF